MASPSPSPPSLSPTPHPAHLHASHPSHQATAPQSKRDKRRHALSEKLTTLTTSFHNPSNPRSRDLHYRAQLASLQADMQLITKCDVSGRNMRLLDDSGETIQKEVDETLKAMGVGDLVSTGSGEGKEEAAGLAGRWYREFVEQVNEANEDRDAQLAMLWSQHRSKAQSLATQHLRSVIHAREEHKVLAATIRNRLTARLKAQLKKLVAEKESNSSSTMSSITSISASTFTDIAENNALLLHPSQFGIVAGLGSPRRGGDGTEDVEKEGGRRKPRRRAGEVEELLAFGVGVNFDLPGNSKRKRGSRSTHTASNAAASVMRDERDDDLHHPIPETVSPATTLTLDLLQQAGSEEVQKRKREEIMKQVYTPIYHIDKLFTEKELQSAGNHASMAAVRYFTERQHQHLDDEDDPEEHGNTGSNTPLVHDTAGEDDHESDEHRRERGISPMTELTRLPYAVNTRSNPPRNGGSTRELDGLVHGVPLGMTYVNKAGIAPPPPPLRSEEAERDLTFLRRAIVEGDFGSGGEEMGRGGSGRSEKRNAGIAGLGISLEGGKKVRR